MPRPGQHEPGRTTLIRPNSLRRFPDAAAAYHKRVMPREHLLKAFTPLYLGRTASFVLETQGLTTQEAEGRIEQLCLAFEQQKPYLIARWGDQKT